MKLLLILTLLSITIYAKKVALLVETASGYPIYSNLDIKTIKKLLGKGYYITTLNKPQATSKNIRKHLASMSKLKKDDIFVFYYSGHGERFKRDKNSQERDKQDDFLVTSDMVCKSNVIDNVLIDKELNHLYAQIPAKKVIIIDACHSSTMYKGIGKSSILSKLYKGDNGSCNSDLPFTKGYTIPKNYSTIRVSNIIHLGASNENESAEGSDEGGIFTLALQKAIKERGDVSFIKLLPTVRKNIKPIAKRLGAIGAFKPFFNVNDLDSLTTKDIFVVLKTREQNTLLKEYLDSNSGGINLQIQKDKRIYAVNDPIVLKAKVANSNRDYYLIDMLDKNRYKILEKSRVNKCTLYRNKRYCQFKNLIASAPFRESNIYMVITSKALSSRVSQIDKVLRGNSLVNELKNSSIEVGRVSFEVSNY